MVFICRWEKIIIIKFLLMLAVTVAQAQEKSARICVNQLGYASEQQKIALLVSPEPSDSPNFSIMDSLGNTVYTDQGTNLGLLWGMHYYGLDFSRFDKTGSFHIVSSENASAEFVIQKNPWALIDLMTITDQFYKSVICSGACSKGEKGLMRHQEDVALPVNRIPLNGQEEIISGEFSGDCSGGYHSSNLLDKETYYNAYSLLILATHFGQEKLWIPVIDRYAQQLLKMQHEDGSFAFGVMASNARFPRRLIDNALPDVTSLGVAALAASVPVLKTISQDRADRCYKAAEKGIRWLEDHLRNYEKPLDLAYFPLQANAIWAFVEMYRLTGEGKYMRKVLLLFKELKVEDLFSYVSKPNPTIFSLTRILPFLDKVKQDEMKLFFDRWVDIQRKIFHQSPFGINLRYFQDQLNTSLLLLNNSFDLLAVSQVNQDQEIARLAISQLRWIFGLNPYLVSLVHGVGRTDVSEGSSNAYGTVITGPFGGSNNLALLKPASAFSVQDDGDFAATNAVDGSMATRWSSDFFEPQWFQIDLETDYTIEHIIIHWEVAYAHEYQILVSEDDEIWQEVFSTSHGNGNEDEIVFKPVNARYIRIVCGKRAGV
ncbi:MAG: discoidin domain-containing protein, partial [Chlamydiota bacterium]|nr:discoidin domain-containing protein [Chlamydiota bacterium]